MTAQKDPLHLPIMTLARKDVATLHEDSYSQFPAAEEADYSRLPPAVWDC